MPQLNPSPWFFYLLLAWLIPLFLMPNKILGHINLAELNPQNMKMVNFMWAWPWQ